MGAAAVAGRAARGLANLPAGGVQAARSSGLARGGPSKLLTAAVVGAIVLAVMAYVTGQDFRLDWRGLGQHPLQPAGSGAYLPLYGGQQAELLRIATGQAPATMAQQNHAAQLLHAQVGP